MPNILTHMAVASNTAQDNNAEILLGSVLPDFLGMYRDYSKVVVDPVRFDELPLVALGIRLHRATDTMYDAHPYKKLLNRHARSDLFQLGQGMSRGAVIACADNATDILLDGVMIEANTRFEDFIKEAGTRIVNLSLEYFAGDPGLEEMIKYYFESETYKRYAEPSKVAHMLFHRFNARPGRRLAFSHECLPDITASLENHKRRIGNYAVRLLRHTSARVII